MIFEKLLDLIYPPKCMFCGKIEENHICKDCIKIVKNEEKTTVLDDNAYLFEYKDKLRDKIIEYKFDDKPYLYNLLRYNRILKMRNQILKSMDSNESKIEQLKLFTPQLIDTAVKIIEKRLNFIEKLKIFAKNIHKDITLDEDLNIVYSYKPKENLSIKQDLENEFNKNINKEIELGYTCFGPHRDDIEFSINGLDCKAYASQGQQRTVSLVVKLSLMEVIKHEIGEYPILLLDDVLSELDSSRQTRLLNICKKFQTFISCTKLPEESKNANIIRIENGKIYFVSKLSKEEWVNYGIAGSQNEVKASKNYESEITGFSKKVVDVKCSWNGQTINEVYLVFLMEDGTLTYTTIQNLIKNSTVEGKVNNVLNIQRIYNCSVGYRDGGGFSSVVAIDNEDNLYDIGYILFSAENKQ